MSEHIPSKNDLGRDRWPNVTDGDWLRKLAEDTFGEHHMQRDTANRLRQIAARCDGRSSDETGALAYLVIVTDGVKNVYLTKDEAERAVNNIVAYQHKSATMQPLYGEFPV